MHAPAEDRTEMLTITMGVTRVFAAEYCRACAPLALASHIEHADKTRPTSEQLAHYFTVKARKEAKAKGIDPELPPKKETTPKGGAR